MMRAGLVVVTSILVLAATVSTSGGREYTGSPQEQFAECSREGFRICEKFEDDESAYNECFMREQGACKCLKPEPTNWGWGEGTWCTDEDRKVLRDRQPQAAQEPTKIPEKRVREAGTKCHYYRSSVPDRVAVAKMCFAECGGDASVSAPAGDCFERCTNREFCD
jgi:hypothetical protein